MEIIFKILSVLADIFGVVGFLWAWKNYIEINQIKLMKNSSNVFSNIKSWGNGRDGIRVGDDRNG